MNAHLSQRALADYVAEALAPDDQLMVEEHVADCDACALAAQGTFAASSVLDQWTARTHGAAATHELLAGALAAASARSSAAQVRQRLEAWAQHWSGQAEAALKIVLEAPGQAARIVTDGIQDLARPGTAWQFAPAPAAIPTRGAARRSAVPQPVVVTAGGPDGLTARVAVSGERGEIVVRLDSVPTGAEPPLVLLVPTGPDSAGSHREPRLGTPQPSPGSDAWIARFERLDTGSYLIAFEPQP